MGPDRDLSHIKWVAHSPEKSPSPFSPAVNRDEIVTGHARERALDLIDGSRPWKNMTPEQMADWIGRARVVLEELTRDA